MVLFSFLNIFVFLISVSKLEKKKKQQKSGGKCMPSTSSCPTSIKDFLKAFSSSDKTTASKAKETGIILLID